ncbi:MAG: hypothetical protein AAF141_10440, partial [Pseudomonadota bacterium]
MADFLDSFIAFFDRQGKRTKALIVAATFLVMSFVMTSLFVEPSLIVKNADLRQGAPVLILLVGLLLGATVAAYRLIRSQKMDWLGLALFYPIVVPVVCAGGLLLISLLKYFDGATQIAGFALWGAFFLPTAAILIIAPIRRADSFCGKRDAARDLYHFTLGVATVAIVSRFLSPSETIAGGFPFFSMSGPIVAMLCAGIYFWRRDQIGSFLLWPVASMAGFWAIHKFAGFEWLGIVAAFMIDGASERGELRLLLALLLGAPFTLLGGLAWEIAARFLRDEEWRKSVNQRFRAFESAEFHGRGNTQKLEKRRSYIWRDLALFWVINWLMFEYLAGAGTSDGAQSSDLAAVGVVLAMFGMQTLLVLSVPLRLFAKRRFRWISVFAVPVAASILTGAFSALVINSMSLEFEAAFTTIFAIFGVACVAMMILLSRLDVNRETMVLTTIPLVGYMLADVVFTTLLGSVGGRFRLGIEIGEIASVVTGLVLLVAYLFNRDRPDSFL